MDTTSISSKSQKLLIKKKKFNLAINILIAFLGVTSLYMKFFIIDGALAFRAFTVNGNLFTTLVTFFAIFVNVAELKSKKDSNSKLVYYLMLCSAVTEAVIFIVVMIGYLPFVPDKPAITPYHMFCLHVAIPILSVLRFIFFEKPLGILKPQNLLIGAIPIGIYGLGVTIAIKLGVLPTLLVPYSFLDFDNNFIWYFLFCLFAIPAFGYLWSWLFYRLNIRASVLWFNETDVRNLERKRLKAMSRFDVVNTSILLVFCGLSLLLLAFSLMNTSKTVTKVQHELLGTLSFVMLDDYNSQLGTEDWYIKDGSLYKGDKKVGDGTEAGANYSFLPGDEVVVETEIYVKASDLRPEVAAKYNADDYVNVVHSAGKLGPVASTGDVLNPDTVESVFDSETHSYYEETVFEEDIDHPLYNSEYRKYFETEKKDRQKYYHYSMTFGKDFYTDGVGIISIYIPVASITAQAKQAEYNADISMMVIILIIFTILYLVTITWIKGLEKSYDYLAELACNRIPDEPLRLGKGKRISGLADRVNKIRKEKIAKEENQEEELSSGQ